MDDRASAIQRPLSRKVSAIASAKPTVVLGIDPGTAVTGYGVVSSDMRGHSTLVECGVIRTAASQPLSKRLLDIHEGISEIIVLGHARGVILLAAETAGIAIDEYPPAEIKKVIVGAGAATKAQIQFMVMRLLRLKSPPQPADAADGVAAALCSCMSPRMPRSLLLHETK